jgi:HSP20 family protein
MVFNGNLIPWNWGKKNLPVRKENGSQSEQTPYFSLQQDMNLAFDNFFRIFENGMMTPFSDLSDSTFQPRVEVKESSADVRVSVELPGIDEKDLDVSISNNYLTVKGEKREEKEDNSSGYYRMERTYGSFHRSIPFPCEIDKDRAEATFKRGVLTVILPKTVNSQQQVKKITIKKE